MKLSLTILTTLGVVFTRAAPAPAALAQGIDFGVVNDLPPLPSYTIAVGVAAQTVSINEASVISSAAALASKVPLSDALDGVVSVPPLKKRFLAARAATSTCSGGTPQATGSGPVSTPDTPAGFTGNTVYGNTANAATTPSGYTQTFGNLMGSSQAYGYLGFTSISTYDPATCAAQCSKITDCYSFNICTPACIEPYV